jgi:pyrroline-5-carboxylate reductase
LSEKIGFIGTGAITDAMVRGLLAKPAAVPHVMASKRSSDVSARLAADFPRVLVSGDNQAIVDGCDTVVFAVRPMKFSNRQKVHQTAGTANDAHLVRTDMGL